MPSGVPGGRGNAALDYTSLGEGGLPAFDPGLHLGAKQFHGIPSRRMITAYSK